ncbi:hypothetical protein [Clostridium sp. L74]|nr:hypothetical protein [Clostridium sp. L74]KOR26790.1 hypothetical protein ND00_03170 [Clostridium sp. L74]
MRKTTRLLIHAHLKEIKSIKAQIDMNLLLQKFLKFVYRLYK